MYWIPHVSTGIISLVAGIDPSHRRRLGDLVKARRLARGLSVSRAAKLAGRMDRATWTAIEEGIRETEEYTLARIEPVLYWRRGSVAAVLGGGDQVELPLPEDELERVRSQPSIDDIPLELRQQGTIDQMIQWLHAQPWERVEKLAILEQLLNEPSAETPQSGAA